MHRVGFVVPQGFQMMSVAALTAFEIANMPPSGRGRSCVDRLIPSHRSRSASMLGDRVRRPSRDALPR